MKIYETPELEWNPYRGDFQSGDYSWVCGRAVRRLIGPSAPKEGSLYVLQISRGEREGAIEVIVQEIRRVRGNKDILWGYAKEFPWRAIYSSLEKFLRRHNLVGKKPRSLFVSLKKL